MPVAVRLLVLVLGLVGCGETPAPTTWSHYAGDAESTRYAPLDQIDASNFARLRVAWSWESVDVRWKREMTKRARQDRLPFVFNPKTDLGEFQLTPIYVDGVLYGITPVGHLFALDAGTGEALWVHDTGSYRSSRDPWDFIWPKHRGVAYADGRIFVPTFDAWLLAVDAGNGEPVRGFGDGGRVDLMAGLRGPPSRRLGDVFHTSPPVVVGDTVVVGSSIDDRPAGTHGIPGDVRGYDTRTGRLKWTFHVVPREGETGVGTWEDGAWRRAGAANAWGPMSVDPARGSVFVVTSTPTNDFYGGHRKGDDLYAESLLCLDGATGALRWHFQLVHHGLWDYDPSASPILVDVEVDGRRVAAVAQPTKQGFLFVLDRETGEPVWPIEERPVPGSDVPGERAAATQPFPTKPPPYEPQGTWERDLADFTPEIRARALDVFRRFETGPLFLPPSERGSLIRPGPSGGTSWRGAAVDVETGVLYVPSVTLPAVLTVTRTPEGAETDFDYTGTSRVWDTAGPNDFGPAGLPLFQPPYSRITAIDLTRGEQLWQVANGEGPRDHPLLAHLDLPRLGSGAPTGVFVTRTLLVATDGADHWLPALGGPILRAYDKATGALVGEVTLPAKARGVPMTYLHDGVQYIAVAVSSKGRPGEPGPVTPRLVALALP